MDKYTIQDARLGRFHIVEARGGMTTIRDRAALEFGQASLVQNLRCWHPGYETRKGYDELSTAATDAAADSILNIYQFSKGKVSEQNIFVQYGDGDLHKQNGSIPTQYTGAFGTEVHDGSAGQLPAAFSNINDYMIYSNAADQHQVYAGQTQKISAFVVVKDSAAHGMFPDMGQDYFDEVTDGLSTTVAVLDSLGDYTNDFDAVYLMTKTPIDKINITIAAANGTLSQLRFDYWNGSWTQDTITDGTSVAGVTFAQTGTLTCATVAPDRTDEIPRYMFNQSGFWYKLSLEYFTNTILSDLTNYTIVDEDSDLATTASKMDFDTLRADAVTYAVYDLGVDYVEDFEVDFEVEITANTAATPNFFVAAFSNTLGTHADMTTATDGVGLFINHGARVEFYLEDLEGGPQSDSWDSGSAAPEAIKYCTLTRVGTALNCVIYSDASRETVVDTLTLTGPTTKYRYFYCLANKDVADVDSMTGYVQNYVAKFESGFDAEVEVSEVTYDCESFINLVNVWNGVPTDLIEAEFDDDSESVFNRYSTSAITLDTMTSSDKLYVSSAYPLEAIYFDFGDTPSTTLANTITIKYWDGAAFQNTTENDGTSGWTESGWIHFGRQSGEFKRQFKDTRYFAYWYEITVASTLGDDVVASILGMPHFDITKLGQVGRISATWKNRGLYSFDRFPRDIYVTQAADHMFLNGADYGILQPGDGRDNASVAAVRFHNEIMVFQEEIGKEGGCVTIFEGYSPATFGKMVLSTAVGTFSPKSVDVVDGSKTSLTKRDMEAQTMVFFLSHYGVFMSDGRIVTGISDDIQNYFDERFSECIRTGYEKEMWLSFDKTENLIKIGIVSGPSATTCNKFFCYDLTDGVWYEDVYNDSISVFTTVQSDTGQLHKIQVAGGSTSGFLYRMNYGTNDVGNAITAKATWEFKHGPFLIDVEEILTRVKVQGAGTSYTWVAEENDVQVDTKTGSMVAAVASDTMRRNRHQQKTHNISWTSFTITANTLDVPIYLYDMGVIAKSKEFK